VSQPSAQGASNLKAAATDRRSETVTQVPTDGNAAAARRFKIAAR
jgi:hypothetical protein